MTTTVLSRNLRARQSAARCEGMAVHNQERAARFPEGSALRADYLALAEDYRGTAAQWRALVSEPEERPSYVGTVYDSTDEERTKDCCGAHPWDECDDECGCGDCDSLRALDLDADAHEER